VERAECHLRKKKKFRGVHYNIGQVRLPQLKQKKDDSEICQKRNTRKTRGEKQKTLATYEVTGINSSGDGHRREKTLAW